MYTFVVPKTETHYTDRVITGITPLSDSDLSVPRNGLLFRSEHRVLDERDDRQFVLKAC